MEVCERLWHMCEARAYGARFAHSKKVSDIHLALCIYTTHHPCILYITLDSNIVYNPARAISLYPQTIHIGSRSGVLQCIGFVADTVRRQHNGQAGGVRNLGLNGSER